MLPWAGLVVALLAVQPPYARHLTTETRVEVADHVVPAVLIFGVSVAMVMRARRRVAEIGSFPLVAGFLMLLAGLWMTATHIPLVNQARRGTNDVSYLDAVWHTFPGVLVLVLGLVWTTAWWSASPGEPDEQP